MLSALEMAFIQYLERYISAIIIIIITFPDISIYAPVHKHKIFTTLFIQFGVKEICYISL